MTGKVYGIDLGTNNIKIYKKGKGIVLNEKNMIAIKNESDVIAIGDEAFEMFEKAPDDVVVTFPLRNGVIADMEYMRTLFRNFIYRINKGSKVQSSKFVVAVPTDITEVEKRAFFNDLIDNNIPKVKNIYMVEKPVAAVLGSDLDVTNASGVMMVDIGASTTEIAVLSLGGIVISKLLPIGGDTLDEAIVATMKKNCKLVVGKKTAERLKIELGCAYPNNDSELKIYGRNVVTGLPQDVLVKSPLVNGAIREHLDAIVEAIKGILERTPPEIAADIIDNGIWLSGGSSKVKRFDELIAEETELTVNICDKPSTAVIKGLGRIIEEPALSQLAFSVYR